MSLSDAPVSIRSALPADCAAMAGIYAQSLAARDSSMEDATSAQAFQDQLDAQGERECFLVVEIKGHVLGYGVVKAYSPRVGYRVACETSIYLDRSHTGAGLGRALQQALLDRCRDFGYHHVVAKIWASNGGSIRFHQRFGFEMVGIQRQIGYMAGQWRDVAILQLILSDVEPHKPDLA